MVSASSLTMMSALAALKPASRAGVIPCSFSGITVAPNLLAMAAVLSVLLLSTMISSKSETVWFLRD